VRILHFCLALVTALALNGKAEATPTRHSCLFLDVMGKNVSTRVPSLINEIATTWPERNRNAATETLRTVLDEITFSGGSVWRIAQLGDEIEEHLIVLRHVEGEVSGVRLLYQWSSDGLILTTMDFKRRYSEFVATPMLQTPESIECSSSD